MRLFTNMDTPILTSINCSARLEGFYGMTQSPVKSFCERRDDGLVPAAAVELREGTG